MVLHTHVGDFNIRHFYIILSWDTIPQRQRSTSKMYDRIDHIDPFPDSKVHVAHMGHTWVLSSPGGSHVGPMTLAIRGYKLTTQRQTNKSQQAVLDQILRDKLHWSQSGDNLSCSQWRQSWHHDNSRFWVCFRVALSRLLINFSPERWLVKHRPPGTSHEITPATNWQMRPFLCGYYV